jgi:urea transport system permease protein
MKRPVTGAWLGRWGVPLLLLLLLLAMPLLLSDFRLNQLGRFLALAIVAVGLDLIWGYGGMLSLGQGLFFGLGAYGFAMYLKLQASGGKLPDFMFWSGLTDLPWFWAPFATPVFAIAAALIIPGLLAGILGYFVFRSRVQGVYFSIITQALTLLTSIWFVGQQAYTGGTNGITNIGAAELFGRTVQSKGMQEAFYWATVIALALVFVAGRWLVATRFGRVLVATRDDESRLRFLGYNPVTIKVTVFVISAIVAALGGMLYVPQVGIISPSALGVIPSIEFVIFVALGGRGTLLGAILGTLLVSYGRSFFSESFPDLWVFFLGLLFIASVLFFPKGVVGSLSDLFQRRAARRRPVEAPARTEPAGMAASSGPGVNVPASAEGGS